MPHRALVTYAPSIEPQELTLRLQLIAPPTPVVGPFPKPPFDQRIMVEWMERGAGLGSMFAPGDSHVEVLEPFAWGPEVVLAGRPGELASPGSAPVTLPGALEARWRVRALSEHAIAFLAYEMLRDPPRAAGASDDRFARVRSLEVVGSRGGATRELDASSLGRPFPNSGKAPPFPIEHEPQAKTAKRSVTIRAADPKNDEVRSVLYWTMQHWGEIVGRWFETTAPPEERLHWLDTEETKLAAKGEQFLVRRMDYDDPTAFDWPFDVARPLGLLVDMLHTAHLRGTAIRAVTARL